jgi:murein L,D-transpeptidase YafK
LEKAFTNRAKTLKQFILQITVILIVLSVACPAQVNNREREARRAFEEAWNVRIPNEVYLRVSKSQATMIVYARYRSGEKVSELILDTIPICNMDFKQGTKRYQGDRKTPEGLYKVVRFNPSSRFYLSMKIDYPHKEDITKGYNPGGDIFIHGTCASIGCIAIKEWIKPLYWLCRKTGKVIVDIRFE